MVFKTANIFDLIDNEIDDDVYIKWLSFLKTINL